MKLDWYGLLCKVVWAAELLLWVPMAVLFTGLAIGIAVNQQWHFFPGGVLGVVSFYGVFRAYYVLWVGRPEEMRRVDYWLVVAGFMALIYIVVVGVFWREEGFAESVAMVAVFPMALALKLMCSVTVRHSVRRDAGYKR